MGNDLSFNVIALDRYEKTMLGLTEHLKRIADQLDKLDGKTVTADVNIRTDESRKSLDSFTNRFQLLAGAIVAGSPFIGAAILGGVGAGFIGAAALAQKSNKDIQESYKQLWQDVSATTQNASDQLVPQLTAAGHQLDAEVQKLGPDIKKAMSAAGPDIVALTTGVTNLAGNAMPGLTAAMQNSLPVTEGFSILMGNLGTVAGRTLTDLSQHSAQFGVDLQSLGSIIDSTMGVATTLITGVADVWAKNAGGINSAIHGIGESASGLVTGVLPAFSTGLNAAAQVITGITTVLAPLSPLLGTVGGAALVLWGTFKLAGVATAGVRGLATGVVSLGANMEVAAVKSAGFIASLRGVGVQASATATAVKAAGAAAATTAVSTAAAAESLAGPIGIALAAGTILFGLFSGSEDTAAESAQNLAAATDTMTSAFEASHGAVTQSIDDAVASTEEFKKAAVVAERLGVNQAQLAKIIEEGGPKYDELRAKAQGLADEIDRLSENHGAGQAIIGSLEGLKKAYDEGRKRAAEFATEQQHVAVALVGTSQFQGVAAETANALGLSLGEVSVGFAGVVSSGGAASKSTDDVAAAFAKTALTVSQARLALQDHFTTVDKGVRQAADGVLTAGHSYQQSVRSVQEAQHSLAGAQRSLKDAYEGVATAERNYARAQEQERTAAAGVSAARQQAIEDLKELHLQLQDQVVTEESAQVRLFEATQAGAKLGVDASNAQALAGQQVTEGNLDQVKAAIDLLSAQNALNETLHRGQQLRTDVASADAAGVDGSKAVRSAQEQLRSAQEQTRSASVGLAKAHQQVTDAAYGVQRATLAVKDAEYARQKSAQAVAVATENLRTAQENASRSLDINTKAGQDNLSMLLQLWAAINASGLQTQDKYKKLVDDTATSFGISREKAQDYLTQLGLIPKDFKYNVTAVAGADLSAITETTINGVRIFTSAFGSGGIASAGRLASGGPIVGTGGPTDDANLIWASHGEYMQPADVVDYYGPGVMEAMRRKKLRVVGSDGAALPGFAKGGLVDAFAAYTNLSSAYVADVNTLQVMGFGHPPQLPQYVPPAAAAFGFSGTPGVARWAPQILQALTMLGQSSDWLGVVERRMMQESGGNPTVVNRWDSNWLRGTPSVGLMQVIGPTFAHNAGQFADTGPFLYGVSVDPLANIFAGLHYAIGRYGSLSALNRPGGYDSGGWLMPGGTNQTGRPEAVLNPDESAAFVRLAKTGGEVHVHFHGPVGSQRELENWLTSAVDKLKAKGRM